MNKFIDPEARQLTSAEAGLWLFICCQKYPIYRMTTTIAPETPAQYLRSLIVSSGDETVVNTAKSIRAKLFGVEGDQ